VKAAEVVCPDPLDGYPFVATSTEQCRQQAIARAVHDINNPRLAGIYTVRSKNS
jgi:hypothetical protein